jgi:hypothetical protein
MKTSSPGMLTAKREPAENMTISWILAQRFLSIPLCPAVGDSGLHSPGSETMVKRDRGEKGAGRNRPQPSELAQDFGGGVKCQQFLCRPHGLVFQRI